MPGKKNVKKCGLHRAVISEAIVSAPNGILLLRRSRNNNLYVGKWQLPGGKAKKGETPLGALRREIFEETGCRSARMRLVKRIVFKEKFRGQNSEVVLNVYSCKLSGAIRLSCDHSKSRFVKKSKISRNSLSPVSKKALFDDDGD